MYELTVFEWSTATDTSILDEGVGPVVIDVDVDGIKSSCTGIGIIRKTYVKDFMVVPSGGSISMSLNESNKNVLRTSHAIELKCVVAPLN